VGWYQQLERTTLPQWILNTEAAGMSETPVTAYQTSRRYKVEDHTHNISYFHCGNDLYMVPNNLCIFMDLLFSALSSFIIFL
jgi:hypothetical protein